MIPELVSLRAWTVTLVPRCTARNCSVPCPLSSTGAICDNNGICFEGTCFCNSGFCGKACEDTICSECDEGWWGAGCTKRCPLSNNVVCTNNGICFDGVNGDGNCCYNRGFSGLACEIGCKGDGVCSLNGICDPQSSVCTCFVGYAGDGCELKCPTTEEGLVCNNYGTCDSQGKCQCELSLGWAGDSCTLRCPGGLIPCSQHGSCQANATCLCSAGWTGENCDRCEDGLQGLGCSDPCVNGVTNGTQCLCKEYWSGPGCTVPCPGLVIANCSDSNCLTLSDSNCFGDCVWDVASSRCFGTTSCVRSMCSLRGTCDWGNTASGTCSCTNSYYGSNCNVYCAASDCIQKYNVPTVQCMADGTCGCQSDDIRGHFTDLSTGCTTCETFWYGADCTFRCACNDNGRCDQVTGACKCFADDVRGYWSGIACDSCVSGYIGQRCNILNVFIPRLIPSLALISNPLPPYNLGYLVMTPSAMLVSGVKPALTSMITNNYTIEVNSTRRLSLAGDPRLGFIGSDGRAVVVHSLREGNTGLAIAYQIIDGVPLNLFNISLDLLVPRENYTVPTSTTSGGATSYRSVLLSTQRRLFTTTFTREQDISVIRRIDHLGIVILTTLGDIATVDTSYRMPGNVFTYAIDVTYDALLNQMVTVGNVKNRWQAVATDMSGTVRAVYSQTLAVPFCTLSPCTSALRVITVKFRTYIILLNNLGIGVAQFLTTAVEASLNSEMLVNSVGITSASVTAVAYDETTGLIYIALNIANDPSIVVKFYAVNGVTIFTPRMRGSMSTSSVGFSVERINSFFVLDSIRQLWALTASAAGAYVTPLALFSVASIYPSVADSLGGTPVTLTGEGFWGP